MALDGFFPKDIFGRSTSVFTDRSVFRQALPILTFLLSVGVSALGSSKFFLVGPLRLLSHEAPLSGILSLTFITTIFVNISFVFRVYAIEHVFFSSFYNYTLENSIEKNGVITSSIEPLISHQLRLPLYFLPILPSIAFNIFSLRRSLDYKNLIKLFFTFPQYFIAPGFLPLMFQGITTDDPEQRTRKFKLKVWKRGSMINTIYIIFFPQLILVVSDILRGIIHWKFIVIKDLGDAHGFGFLEKNTSILKHPYGNIIFSLIVCTLCTAELAFLVWKLKKLFVEESDVLAFHSYDTTSWTVSWARELSSNYDQTNDLEVRIIT